MSNTDSNGNGNAKAPITYSQIKILGIGSFGKAYLVECNNDKVKFSFLIQRLLLLLKQ